MGKHTCVIEISDYDYDDLKRAIQGNCEMSQLFWPKEIGQAVETIARDFVQTIAEKTPDECISYTKAMFAWALFIGICMGADKKVHVTRHDETQVC